jgi:hypothetical protein
MSMTGTCLCGAVRYESSAEPVFSGHCHCVDCQKETGGGHLTIAAVPNDSVTVSGPVTTFRNNGGSGQPVERVFCSVCGTTVFARPTVFGSVTMLRVPAPAATVLKGPCRVRWPGRSVRERTDRRSAPQPS